MQTVLSWLCGPRPAREPVPAGPHYQVSERGFDAFWGQQRMADDVRGVLETLVVASVEPRATWLPRSALAKRLRLRMEGTRVLERRRQFYLELMYLDGTLEKMCAAGLLHCRR